MPIFFLNTHFKHYLWNPSPVWAAFQISILNLYYIRVNTIQTSIAVPGTYMPFFKNTTTTQIFINSCINVKAATLHIGTDAEYICSSGWWNPAAESLQRATLMYLVDEIASCLLETKIIQVRMKGRNGSFTSKAGAGRNRRLFAD